MVVLAVILILLGYTIAPPPVAYVGWVLLLIALVLMLAGGFSSYSYY